MDRNEYLKLCQREKVYPNTCKVIFDGIPYIPKRYLMDFDDTGKPIHIAIVRDLKANCEVQCLLEKVKEYGN